MCVLLPTVTLVCEADYINQFPASLIDDRFLTYSVILDTIRQVSTIADLGCVVPRVFLIVLGLRPVHSAFCPRRSTRHISDVDVVKGNIENHIAAKAGSVDLTVRAAMEEERAAVS